MTAKMKSKPDFTDDGGTDDVMGKAAEVLSPVSLFL